MQKTVLGLTLPLIFLFSACGAAVEESTTPQNGEITYDEPDSNENIVEPEVGGTVEFITIRGVDCMIYDATNGGGAMTCDWDHRGFTEDDAQTFLDEQENNDGLG